MMDFLGTKKTHYFLFSLILGRLLCFYNKVLLDQGLNKINSVMDSPQRICPAKLINNEVENCQKEVYKSGPAILYDEL